MTVREALAEGSAALRTAGIASPHLDASLLLADILKVSRSSLLAAAPGTLTEASLTAFHALVRRRLGGESIAYILGRKEFYGLEFKVNPSVLVPRPDTETLVEAALAELRSLVELQKSSRGRLPLAAPKASSSVSPTAIQKTLDLCTGSGAIAIALKHTMPGLAVWAADISAEALTTARTNAARLLPPDSEIYFCQGNLFEAVNPPRAEFHLIVSNPPYVPTGEIAGLSPEVRAEPPLALDGGSDGLDVIRKIIFRAPEFLCPGGLLLLEADPRQMYTIASLLEQSGLSAIQTHNDLSGNERVIGGRLVMP